MHPTSTDRISLQFRKTLDIALFDKGFEVWLWRVLAMASFKTPAGWTRPYEAIVDTGAPLSILPAQIWNQVERKILFDHDISGVVPGASLPVQCAEISACLVDSSRVSRQIRFKAYLSGETRVPLLLGFDGFLAKSTLTLNPAGSKGFLEF
ncbi:MAG: hypothetical protein HY922_14450, partial [Elusimicrobia bacterium]|nr:hypothetical protein [Elusimicrobiota bacterium]